MNGNPKKCLLCGADRYRVIFSYGKPDKYEAAVGVSVKGYFRNWVECRSCGFCYSVYSRPQKILDKLYAENYRDKRASWRDGSPEETFKKITALPKNKSETKLRVSWIKENIAELWRQGIIPKSRPPYKLLDIGGGAGIFAYEFKDALWRPHVIDPWQGGVFIRAKLRIPLVQTVYRPKSFKGKFTLISLIYVLEHLLNPGAILKELPKDMQKNSLLYIEVPDALCFRFLKKNHDIFNACHLWMFDPKSLTAFLNDRGFEVFNLERIKTIRGHYALMALAHQL